MSGNDQDAIARSAAREDFRNGVIEILPIALGVAFYGAAFGLLAAQASMDGLQVGVMGAIVFAGSSQIVAVERVIAGAGAIAAVIAGLALNLRLALIAASIRDLYRGRPLWQVMLGAHAATDENWALLMSRRNRGLDAGYWYLVGSGLGLITAWLSSTVAGVLVATAIPEPRALGLDFAFTAAFIALVIGLWRGREDITPWLLTALLVAGLTVSDVIDPTWTIVIGGIVGAGVAALFTKEAP